MNDYPSWLHGPDSIMGLPKPYIEFFVRWYYYENTDKTEIPDTIPVENIEDYIVAHMNSAILWGAKGFVSARNVDKGDNLNFNNDGEFTLVCHCIAKLWYKNSIMRGWITKNITKIEFLNSCHFLKHGFGVTL